MAIEDVARRVTYTGNGKQTDFPFAFVVFNAETDILVYQKVDDASEVAVPSSDFSVTLNSDQASNPGGKVTMGVAPGDGVTIVILSNVAYEQTMELTTHDGFDPRTLNRNADRIVAQIQQLKEGLSRAIVTGPTDTLTPEELKNKLLDAANDATVIAKGYAEAAAASATDAKKSRDDILEHRQEVIAAVTAEGDKQDQRLVTEGDTQINRIKAETDNTLIANGMGCTEKFWTLANDVAAGTGIAIPGGIKYLVNRHHLRVSWNGLVLAIGQNFTEVGAEDTFSDTFRLTFDAKAGDEIDIWIGALGKGDVAEALALAGEASAAVADLSRKVVYKEEV